MRNYVCALLTFAMALRLFGFLRGSRSNGSFDLSVTSLINDIGLHRIGSE